MIQKDYSTIKKDLDGYIDQLPTKPLGLEICLSKEAYKALCEQSGGKKRLSKYRGIVLTIAEITE